MKPISFTIIISLIIIFHCVTFKKNNEVSSTLMMSRNTLIESNNNKILQQSKRKLKLSKIQTNEFVPLNPYSDVINYISDDQKKSNELILNEINLIRTRHSNTPEGLKQLDKSNSQANNNQQVIDNNSIP